MFNEIQLAIFDLDGVIVDTAKYHFLAWRRLAHELGFDFTLEQNERLKGVSRVRSLEILLEIGNVTKSKEEQEILATKKNTWYVEFISKMDASEILPGVEQFLSELAEVGVKIALGSASKNAMTILERLGLTHYFDSIIDGNKVSKAKPDPEVFLLAAEQLNILPQNCVVFEDAEAGIEAGIRARMYTIGVGDPARLAQADKVISGFSDQTVQEMFA